MLYLNSNETKFRVNAYSGREKRLEAWKLLLKVRERAKGREKNGERWNPS